MHHDAGGVLEPGRRAALRWLKRGSSSTRQSARMRAPAPVRCRPAKASVTAPIDEKAPLQSTSTIGHRRRG